MQTILTIAGFDPSSGAGITADLAVIAAHGFFGTAAITALTVQSTLGVQSVHPVEPAILAATLDCLQADLPSAGIKIGMLANDLNVRVVTDFLFALRKQHVKTPVVLDPIILSSSGARLLSEAGLTLLLRDTLWLVDWITPNLHELALLDERELDGREAIEDAVFRLVHEYPDLGVVAKGGHLEERSDTADDFVVEPGGKAGEWQSGPKIDSRATHGTGCAYATALLCGLLSDRSDFDAAKDAKNFVARAIKGAPNLGQGQGPMELLWPLRSSPA